jgi:hypothetical protein
MRNWPQLHDAIREEDIERLVASSRLPASAEARKSV